jgi:hypothetical protein
MRGKIVEEVNRVIRQNRTKPNVAVYDFFNTGSLSQAHRAYGGNSEAAPYASAWLEMSSSQYQQLWYSDDERCEVSYGGDGEYAVMLFRFKIESRAKTVKKIALGFEGYGTAPSGDGVEVKAWNSVAAAWQNAQAGDAGGEDEVMTVTLVADLPDYVDADGYVWFLARTLYASNGASPATLRCDYVHCTVTVNGVTYCDILSFRNVDRVDVKPFVFSTEFTVKSWFFENIGV